MGYRAVLEGAATRVIQVSWLHPGNMTGERGRPGKRQGQHKQRHNRNRRTEYGLKKKKKKKGRRENGRAQQAEDLNWDLLVRGKG